MLCDTCHGQRFNAETLAVSWRGKSIGDVLKMEVDEAVEFFASMPSIAHSLQLRKGVGLGYLTLGQASPTLSRGEAQRIRLVSELVRVSDDLTRRGQIDLGPEGGDAGGRIVAAGTPDQVVASRSHTGVALGAVLARR